jgi:hypothetical protein
MSAMQKHKVCRQQQVTPWLHQLILSLGFSRDIGATPDDLNLAVSLFFVTFVIFQPPSAAMGRWLGAKHWITFMMVRLPGLFRE